MNGKVLKVMQYNLQFGATDRFVNVFGCFKYKPNGNIYVIYSDTDTKYNIIYYGSGHVKGNSILCMQCREAKESEYIKEYIFKVTNKENLDNFEMISLNEVEGIEIIGSDKIDVKPEIITSLIDFTLPKKEVVSEEVVEPKEKKVKKKSKKSLLFILLFTIVICIGFYIITLPPKDTVSKRIVCEMQYSHDTLDAQVDETNTYNFNHQDTLESIDTTTIYQFDEEGYQEFIMKGLYYRYLPDDGQEGGYKQDDENYTFKIMMTEKVDTSYNKPTAYEEVLSYYKNQGYTCSEEMDED